MISLHSLPFVVHLMVWFFLVCLFDHFCKYFFFNIHPLNKSSVSEPSIYEKVPTGFDKYLSSEFIYFQISHIQFKICGFHLHVIDKL